MPELEQRIRDLIDLGAEPVTAQEVIDSVAGSPGTVTPAISRRSGRRIVLFGSLATVAALVLVVVGVSLNSTGIHAQAPPASAAAFLDKTASIAASQHPLVPGPDQFLYVRSIEASQSGMGSKPNPRVFRYYVQEVDEVWSSPHGVGRKSDAVVGRPLFITSVDRNTWEQDGSPPLESGWGGGEPQSISMCHTCRSNHRRSGPTSIANLSPFCRRTQQPARMPCGSSMLLHSFSNTELPPSRGRHSCDLWPPFQACEMKVGR